MEYDKFFVPIKNDAIVGPLSHKYVMMFKFNIVFGLLVIRLEKRLTGTK